MRLPTSFLVPVGAMALVTAMILAARVAIEDEARSYRDLEVEAAVMSNRFATGLSP